MNSFIIEKDKIKSNTEEILSRAGAAKTFAVVKGNGYGFGTDEYVSLLYSFGIRYFAVTGISDALKIHEKGLSGTEVLMLRSTSIPEEVLALVQNDIILTVGSLDAAEIVNRTAEENNKVARVHIKINTGMGRYGFSPSATESICSLFTSFPSLSVCGLFTHFSCAFKSEKVTKKQLAAFLEVQNTLSSKGFDCGMVHFANSAYLFNFSSPLGDAVRIGSAFTGRIACKLKDSGLSRVGYLKSRVCELQNLPRGAKIGYGGAYTVKRPIRAAVIPIGYADGFNTEKVRDTYRFRDGLLYALSDLKRAFEKKAYYVTVNGHRCKILGHIGMTHTVFDVTDVPCSIGDEVFLDVNPIYISRGIQREYV